MDINQLVSHLLIEMNASRMTLVKAKKQITEFLKKNKKKNDDRQHYE